MVTAAQLLILQSSIASLIPSILSSINVKLDETNYLAWHFQTELLLEEHSLIGFVDGLIPCPAQFCHDSSGDSATKVQSDDYKVWKMHGKALMQLITATLSSVAISCKLEICCLLLVSFFYDDDIVILTLNGLPVEFNTIRSVIRGRETMISLKDLQSQLLVEEVLVDTIPSSPVLSALMAQTNGLPSKNQSFSGSGGNYVTSNSIAYKSLNQNGKGRNRFGNNFNLKYGTSKNFHSSPAPGILGTSPLRTHNYAFRLKFVKFVGK
ncbi:unnamed protein product [Malus baccata var. baccata]